jgi:CMP-N,N'-diacetyllegionaminic acid synthase
MDKKNLLFTICGRAGSKGVKGKNVSMFCGKPIVYYTLNAYEKFVDRYRDDYNIELAVNTDSDLLIQQIKDRNVECHFISRKESLAGDVVAKSDVVRDTLFETEKLTGKQYEIAVDVDITSPLRNISDILGVIKLVLDNEECNFSYSVTDSRRNPYFNMVMQKEDGFYDRVVPTEYTCRQELPKVYDMNASVYGYSRDYLLDMSSTNRRALVWIMEDTAVLDIDNENDYEIMQVLAEYYWSKGKYLDIL